MIVVLGMKKLLPTGSDKTKLREVTEFAPSQSLPDNSISAVWVLSSEEVKIITTNTYKHEIKCTWLTSWIVFTLSK